MQRSTFLGGGVGYSVSNFWHKNLVSEEFRCRPPSWKHLGFQNLGLILTYLQYFWIYFSEYILSNLHTPKCNVLHFWKVVWGTVSAIFDTKILCWGNFGVGTRTQKIPNSSTFWHIADMSPTFPAKSFRTSGQTKSKWPKPQMTISDE